MKNNTETQSNKMTKKELVKFLVTNFRDEYGYLDLRGLDFTNEDVKVILITNMKVNGNLYQGFQEVEKDLNQHKQTVKGSLYQNKQKVEGNLFQDFQNVDGGILQGNQMVEGDLFQDNQNVEKNLVQNRQNCKGEIYS